MTKPPEIITKLHKTDFYADKRLPKLLKYLNKIKTVSDYDKYVKDNIKIPILIWATEYLIIKPILIYICLFCLKLATPLVLTHPHMVLLAAGSSIIWFLLVELKRDLWRK